MANNFKTVQPGGQPLASDIEQIILALTGQSDVGALQLCPQLTIPASATLTPTGSGSGSLSGTYKYRLVYVSGWIDSNGTLYVQGYAPSTTSASITLSSQNINITIPAFQSGQIATLIYRTVNGGAAGSEKYAGIARQGNLTYVDSVVDAKLGTPPTVLGRAIPTTVPTANTTGTSLAPPTYSSMPSNLSEIPNGALITVNGMLFIYNSTTSALIPATQSIVTNVNNWI